MNILDLEARLRRIDAWDYSSTNIVMYVKVRYSSGAYSASIGRARGSSTQSAEIAVRRAAAKYTVGSSLRAEVRSRF